MGKIANKSGGGAQTNINGLLFEQTTSLDDALREAGFIISENHVYDPKANLVGLSLPKYDLYKTLLKIHGIDYRDKISKRYLPDDSFLNISTNVLYIIEKKFQSQSGSVDEKLATFPFKRYVYERLVDGLNLQIKYLYVLSDWFNKPRYSDYYDYMKENECDYFFNEIPLDFLGL